MKIRNGIIALLLCIMFIGQVISATAVIGVFIPPADVDQGDPTLTGVYTDYGVDTDSDGKYNFLAIDVQVNAAQAGYYEVYVEGLNTTPYNYISAYNLTIVDDLSVGVHIITVYLSGETIYDSGIDGPYMIEYVELYFENSTDSDYIEYYYPYTTGAYSYTDFESPIPESYLTDEYSDYGLDLNGNGKCEYLVIEVGFNATTANLYDVTITLLLNMTPVFNTTEIDILTPGVYSVPVYLPGSEIYATGINGPYSVWDASIQSSSDYDYDIGPYVTGAYTYTDFEAPTALPQSSFTGVFDDYGEDYDSDGTYDLLAIDIQLNITEGGYYDISIMGLVSSEDRLIYLLNETTERFDHPGIYTITIFLSGGIIYSSGQDGPYTLYRVFLQSDQGLVTLYEPYTTSFYSYTDFDAPPVYPYATGKYSDFALDTDSDSTYDYLVIKVEVNVTMDSDISVTVSDLVPFEGGWINIENTTEAGFLTEGVYNISVYLPGETIFLSEMNGPYNLWSVEVESNSHSEFTFPDYDTDSYDYTEFEVALVIKKLSPLSGDVLSNTDVSIIWTTNLNTTSEVYIRPEGGTYVLWSGAIGTDHNVEVTSLTEGIDYYYYVSSYSSEENLRTNSTVQSFIIASGIGFSYHDYNFIIDRDYNQELTLSVRNYDDEAHKLLLTVENPYSDLIIGFVGNGSIDRPVYIAPGQTFVVQLVAHAQDAMEDAYYLSLKLTNLPATPEEETFVDYSSLNLTINPDIYVNFTFTEVDDDPHILTKTFNLTNYGDTLTDFRVYAIDDLSSKIMWDPRVAHLRLETNQFVIVKARYNPDLSFTGSASGTIRVKAYSEIIDLPVTFTGDGELFLGRGDASFIETIKTWFCTNRPNVETEFSSLPTMWDDEDCAASIISVDGDVTINGAVAYPGMCIPWHSEVSTGDYGSAEIDIKGYGKVDMEKGSKIIFNEPTTWAEDMWVDFKGKARTVVGPIFGREIKFDTSVPNAVVGNRGTDFYIEYNETTGFRKILLYEGNVDIFYNLTDTLEGLARNPDYNQTFGILRVFNDTSSEYDLIFRNSTDYGDTWLVNQTLLSDPNIGNVSIAANQYNVIIVTYDILGSVHYLRSFDNGTTWSSSTMLVDGNAKFPYARYDKVLHSLQIHWINTTLTNPEYQYRESFDNGTTWSMIKRDPSYFTNVIDAYLEVNFTLFKDKCEYREHDVKIKINGHTVAWLNDTIPEGRYLFPVDTSFLNYANDGSVPTNRLEFDTYHMNGGHYVVGTTCRIIVRMNDVLIPIYAHSLEEADAFADTVPNVRFDATDLGVYSNWIEAPKSSAVGNLVKLNATILNMGDNDVSDVIVRFFVDDPIFNVQIGTDIAIASLAAGSSVSVGVDWTPSLANLTYIFVQVIHLDDEYLTNNIATRSIVVQGPGDAPEITVLYPNLSEAIEGTIFITWSADDPNSDTLDYTLYYGDEGNWMLIAEHVTVTYYEWDTTQIANGQYKIQIEASDDFFTSSDSSDDFFTIDNPVPTTTTTTTTTTPVPPTTDVPWYEQNIFGIALWIWMSGIGVIAVIVVIAVIRRKSGGG